MATVSPATCNRAARSATSAWRPTNSAARGGAPTHGPFSAILAPLTFSAACCVLRVACFSSPLATRYSLLASGGPDRLPIPAVEPHAHERGGAHIVRAAIMVDDIALAVGLDI